MLGHHHHHHEHDDGHDHGSHDHGSHGDGGHEPRIVALRRYGRFALAGLIVASAFGVACLSVVEPGEALVITAFGDPVRVVTTPGLVLRWPAPVEAATPVDLKLRTTSTGLHDVGTRDGLRTLVQAYVEWAVPDDAGSITQYLRAVRNDPDEAARQLRSYVGSALEIVSAQFDLAELVNTDPGKARLDAFEAALKTRVAAQVLATYGVRVLQVGVERLTLSGDTLEAIVARMAAERNTVADRVSAEGDRAAAEVRSDADRDARIALADARVEAARVEAKARLEASDIYAGAYTSDPALYKLLRSLDTLETMVGANTRLVLRTDAAPFRAFVDGPVGSANGADGAAAPVEPPAAPASGEDDAHGKSAAQ